VYESVECRVKKTNTGDGFATSATTRTTRKPVARFGSSLDDPLEGPFQTIEEDVGVVGLENQRRTQTDRQVATSTRLYTCVPINID